MYKISKPSTFLSRYIKCYWTLDNCMSPGRQHVQRIVPSGLHELTFYFKDKPISGNNLNPINENTLLTGQLKTFYDLQISGDTSVFSVLFKPSGLSAFLNLPINELINQSLPIKYILRDGINELEDKLFEAESFSERINIVESFLLNQIIKTEKLNKNRIENSLNIINKAKGTVNINQLASEACYSRKQYEREFSKSIGTSPKQFLKIVRFQNALDIKSKNKSCNLSDLTYACGYYDQPHMINDFKLLTGMTPKEYFAVCDPYSDYFE